MSEAFQTAQRVITIKHYIKSFKIWIAHKMLNPEI